MRILLTNDDGIHAEGLSVLERIARQFSADIWIVAPEADQSGLAHSLSLSEPLRLRQVGDKHFALRGTPTDCVIMAARKIMPEPPDLILSGINAGSNIADDVTYSGTIAGAMEGTLIGCRSIALSQAYHYEGRRIVPWDVAERHAPDLLARLMRIDLPPGIFLNVNFPSCGPDEVEGTAVARQGKIVHGLWVEERSDGRGLPYYWLRFGRKEHEHAEGTDLTALRNRMISVTPLKLDLTAYDIMGTLAGALA